MGMYIGYNFGRSSTQPVYRTERYYDILNDDNFVQTNLATKPKILTNYSLEYWFTKDQFIKLLDFIEQNYYKNDFVIEYKWFANTIIHVIIFFYNKNDAAQLKLVDFYD